MNDFFNDNNYDIFFDDDYDYYKSETKEINEFEEKIEELKESLRESVKDEVKEELKRLRKENKELWELKINLAKIEDEYKRKQTELRFKMNNAKQEAREARLKELFEDTGMSTILYHAGYNFVYKPKCNKCDNDRQIHFKSPSGKDYKEVCECAKRYRKYIPISNELVKFCMGDNCKKELTMWFTPKENSDTYYLYDERRVDYVYNGQPFEEITVNETSLFFKTEEECQRYCDFLNKKNEITDDMK